MKKRWRSLLLSAILVLSLTGCTHSTPAPDTTSNPGISEGNNSISQTSSNDIQEPADPTDSTVSSDLSSSTTSSDSSSSAVNSGSSSSTASSNTSSSTISHASSSSTTNSVSSSSTASSVSSSSTISSVSSSGTASSVSSSSTSNSNSSSSTTNSNSSRPVTPNPIEKPSDPVVYFTSNITPEGLTAVYNKLGWHPSGKVAVKLSTGEPPASNYLRPELIKNLVQSVNGTIVECNTAYGGSRAETALHYQVAKDHGFTNIADFKILDENGSMTLTVNGGSVLKENYVGEAFDDYNSYLVLSHFKGHAMAGYGGAIKNISIGLGSSMGKCWIHSGGTSKTNAWGGVQDRFLEAMAEAGKSVSDYLGSGDRIVYVNVMNRLSVDCDCDGNPAEPDMHDIGILASTDPVALDQACIDLIYAQKNGDGASLVRRIESRNGLHTLEHAEEIGLGSRKYTLVNIDG